MLTYLVIVLFVSALIAFDIWTIMKNGVRTTISVQMYQASMKYPIIPFTVGFMMGHLFFGNTGVCP